MSSNIIVIFFVMILGIIESILNNKRRIKLNLQTIQIIETNTSHFKQIMEVEEQAFGKDKEANLTAGILNDKSAKPVISLLAFDGNKAIGHILFSRGYLEEMTNEQPLFHLLAPLAVIPEYQKQGIGGLLIREGLQRLKEIGSKMVFVLGHINYYPRHGFINDAKKHGYHTIYPIPEEVKDAWMFQSLTEMEYPIVKGKILCCDELNKPEYWRE